MKFTEEQSKALDLMNGPSNLFITGPAGTGKTELVRKFMKDKSRLHYAVVAPKHALAQYLGGMTFNSLFILHNLVGKPDTIINRAVDSPELAHLMTLKCIVIDEVNSVSAKAFSYAEYICRVVRNNNLPWGGIKIIAVGDFLQLSPIGYPRTEQWAFESPNWPFTEFITTHLTFNHRANDNDFRTILEKIRLGIEDDDVINYLFNLEPPTADVTKILTKDVQEFNETKLKELPGRIKSFATAFSHNNAQHLKTSFPIPKTLLLKENAFVIFRSDDADGRWKRGTTGHACKFNKYSITVVLRDDTEVEVSKCDFHSYNRYGKIELTATNFPLTLGYAISINEIQAYNLDEIHVSLGDTWGDGMSYTALSRATSSSGVYLSGYKANAIKTSNKAKLFAVPTITLV